MHCKASAITQDPIGNTCVYIILLKTNSANFFQSFIYAHLCLFFCSKYFNVQQILENQLNPNYVLLNGLLCHCEMYSLVCEEAGSRKENSNGVYSIYLPFSALFFSLTMIHTHTYTHRALCLFSCLWLQAYCESTNKNYINKLPLIRHGWESSQATCCSDLLPPLHP